MGARGPLPRRDRESTVTGHAPKVASPGGAGSPGTVPPLPSRTPTAVQRAWERFWGDSSLSSLVGPSDEDVVYRWARYRALLEKSLKDLERGEGSVMEVQRLERLTLAIESSLGIGPAARARLGVPSGSKSDAQRLTEAFD